MHNNNSLGWDKEDKERAAWAPSRKRDGRRGGGERVMHGLFCDHTFFHRESYGLCNVQCIYMGHT